FPPASRLHHVHAQPDALLQGLRARARPHDRQLRALTVPSAVVKVPGILLPLITRPLLASDRALGARSDASNGRVISGNKMPGTFTTADGTVSARSCRSCGRARARRPCRSASGCA